MAAGLVGRRKPSSFKCLHEALEISPTSKKKKKKRNSAAQLASRSKLKESINLAGLSLHGLRYFSLSLSLEHGPNPEWAGKKAELTPG